MRTIVIGLVCAIGFVGPLLAQQDDTIYKPGGDVSLPKVIKEVRPQYTGDAMRRRVSGAVLLRCVVDREGVPTDLEIVESLDEDLDRASREALQQWRFEPGKKNGKPVLVQIEVKMAFVTKN